MQTWVSGQGGGRRILRVSVREIKKRREIQAKLEGLVEDMRQEQREVVDPKLLMGDRGEG